MELTRKLLDSAAVTLADQRQVKVICSTSDPDRMGDVIVQSGIDLTAYRNNPVVLWGHSADAPIAKTIKIDVENGKLQATVQFPPEGEDEDSDWVYGKIKSGIVNATSVGFIPKDYEPIDSKQPWSGFKFTKSELLEFSFVSVPANAGCLIVGRSMMKSVDVPLLPSVVRESPSAQSTAESDPHPTLVAALAKGDLETAFRLAKTPRAIRQKYLAKSETPDWKVGASRDLSIDDADGWDGPAAAKRMLDDAGFDGDNPDFAKAKRGFLIHDAANPMLRGSYKLPFADIVGGELKAIKGGISAANGRLDQTDAPTDVLDDAGSVIDAYETKIEGSKSAPEITNKSGRRISAANKELLQKAMDHHESATKCIKDVLASNETYESEDDYPNDPDDMTVDLPKEMTEADKRAARLAQVRALRESAKV